MVVQQLFQANFGMGRTVDFLCFCRAISCHANMSGHCCCILPTQTEVTCDLFFFRRAWSQVKAKKTKSTIEILVFTPDVYRGHDNHDKFVRIRTD